MCGNPGSGIRRARRSRLSVRDRPKTAVVIGCIRPEAVIHTRLPSWHSERRDRLEPTIQCSRPVNRSSGDPAAKTASAFISVPSKSAGLSSPIRALVQ